MNNNKKWFVFLLLMMLGLVMAGTAVYADITATYTVSKSVVGGGGHQNSTGGTYALSGTAGQSAAQTAVSGGDYSLTSGFWAENGDDYTATVQFVTDSYSVAEDGNSVEISVVRSGSSSDDVTVTYATSNGTATDGSDYTATSGTLTWYFTNGTSTKTFDIPIINDSMAENDETIMLTLSNPTSGATLGTNATATVTITDDDTSSAGKLQFTSATYSVAEDGGTAEVTIERIGGSSGAVSVNFVVSGGTATAGSDYTSPPQGIHYFPDGSTEAVISITIHDDSVTEGDETVIMTLSSPTGGATLGTAETVLTIKESGHMIYLPMITR